ncbi:MAG: serine hydrolase [Pseudomonadota bacterium]
MRIEILAGHDSSETVLSAPALLLFVGVLALWGSIWPCIAEAKDAAAADAAAADLQLPMQGIPPIRDTQVTRANYAEYPRSRWAFRNPGAVFNTVSIPREGDIWHFASPAEHGLGAPTVSDAQGQQVSLDDLFEANYADGLLVIQGETLLHETYFSEFSPLDKHIWFSMTKSLVSAAFGILEVEGRVDLEASPAKYIPELLGSGFERVTIQQVLDHASALDFKEDYTDPQSDFAQYYLPALNMGWLPGAADVQPDNAEIYGVHDFLVQFVGPRADRQPGDFFNYNSSNADVLGWLIARVSGEPLEAYLQRQIWSALGAEHDGLMVVDRALMAVATSGMATTLRDAARFGMMIRDRGAFAGSQVIPASWVDATLEISEDVKKRMTDHPSYKAMPWLAYHNMWWLLSTERGEFCALGSFGQMIYINRSADMVMVWFSSEPLPSSIQNPAFQAKLSAARELAQALRREREA